MLGNWKYHPNRVRPRLPNVSYQDEQRAVLLSPKLSRLLIVSPNTIKTHVSSIYRKLGVSRRAEAIEQTPRLHLL